MEKKESKIESLSRRFPTDKIEALEYNLIDGSYTFDDITYCIAILNNLRNVLNEY